MILSEKQQLIGHINAFAANIAEFGDGQPPEIFEIPIYDWDCYRGTPAYEFSKLMYQNGQYKEAAEWARRSLAQRLQQFGFEAAETLEAQGSLAATLHSQGDYKEAKQIYTHTIEVKERALGSEHPETLLSKVNLASLLTNEGDYDTAETIYRSALESYKSKFGDSDPNTIITMGALGSLLNLIEEFTAWMDMDDTYQTNYAEAEQLNRRALKLATISFGTSHHRTMAIMDFLGVSLTGLGELEEAEMILQNVFRLRERESGREHPDTVICARHLITVLDRQGKYVEAMGIQVQILGRQGEANLPFRRDHVFSLYKWGPDWNNYMEPSILL
jgi:tetratricopeptide (TPR) repeat protein